jgi:magnesium transporter
MIESPSTSPSASFQLAEILHQVEALVESANIHEAEQLISQLEPSDRLMLLSRLPREIRRALFLGLDAEKAADYLHDIPEVQALRMLERIAPDKAACILEELPKDEQADFVGELTEQTQQSILAEMDSDGAKEVRELIEFSDDEAGGIMIVEFVAVPASSTVADVTQKLQANATTYSDYDVQYIYVVDQVDHAQTGKLVGVLRLRDLVLSEPARKIESMMIPQPLSVSTHTHLREINQFFEDHSFVGVPVVDDQQNLAGVLRRGDVEEAMADRYAEDYLKTQGIVDEELRTMPLALRSRRRLAWLSINILLNIVAASVIAFYQDTLAQVIALAVFLPIISDMSGCSGNQAVAVSMRELSLGLVNPQEVGRVLFKEIGVGLINGLCLGVLIALVAMLWKGNPWLGIVVGIAMMANTLVAVSLGGTLAGDAIVQARSRVGVGSDSDHRHRHVRILPGAEFCIVMVG